MIIDRHRIFNEHRFTKDEFLALLRMNDIDLTDEVEYTKTFDGSTFTTEKSREL